MYFNFAVNIPIEKGKIITKKKGHTTYVLYQSGQIYKPDKKYAVPQRTIIGKVKPDAPTTMYPNERFQEYFPTVNLPEELPDAYRSCALRIGSYAAIKKILEEYKIPQMLMPIFGKDSGLILDLVAYMIVDEENAGQYYPDFAFNHPLFSDKMRIYSDSKVCRLLKSITREQINTFLDEWNRKRDHKQRIYVSYDSTNKNCQAGDIDLIEYGKPKDDQGLPIFNLAIAYDKNNRVPLFYEEYPGSITDVSQFRYMVDKVEQYNYKNVGLILDRGYFSKDNIRYMEDNGHAFVIMVKGQKDLVSSLVHEHRNTFETDRNCNIRAYRIYGKTVMSKLYEDDICERQFHIYYNPSKQAAEREQLEQNLDRMKMYLDKHIGEVLTIPKSYKKYFNVHINKKGEFTSYDENTAYIESELETCGYFCIITSEAMSAKEALIHYKGRDVSEKLFSSDKSFIGSKSMRVQSDESSSAKIFIEFIALIVRNRIYNLLKETLLGMETRQNYMTVPASIRELEKIEMVRRSNGGYRLDHAISKRQRTILSAFGMDDEDIKTLASNINTMLSNNQSLLTETMEAETTEEETYGEDTFNFFD